MRSKWITVRVLNQRLEYESDLDILTSEICLLQQYEKKEEQRVPGILLEGGEKTDETLIPGHPAFCAISVKSGLQFRVEETKAHIREQLAG